MPASQSQLAEWAMQPGTQGLMAACGQLRTQEQQKEISERNTEEETWGRRAKALTWASCEKAAPGMSSPAVGKNRAAKQQDFGWLKRISSILKVTSPSAQGSSKAINMQESVPKEGEGWASSHGFAAIIPWSPGSLSPLIQSSEGSPSRKPVADALALQRWWLSGHLAGASQRKEAAETRPRVTDFRRKCL